MRGSTHLSLLILPREKAAAALTQEYVSFEALIRGCIEIGSGIEPSAMADASLQSETQSLRQLISGFTAFLSPISLSRLIASWRTSDELSVSIGINGSTIPFVLASLNARIAVRR